MLVVQSIRMFFADGNCLETTTKMWQNDNRNDGYDNCCCHLVIYDR